MKSLSPNMEYALREIRRIEKAAPEGTCPNTDRNTFRAATTQALTRRGLIEPCSCRFDASVKEIRLTNKGRAAVEEAR